VKRLLKITARVMPDGIPFTATGQEARTLRLLIERDVRGLAAWDVPSGPPWRLAAYVADLRHKFGLSIITEWEAHAGGRHARYRLAVAVEIIAVTEPGEGRAVA
jgi:hypothetical protein